MGNFLVGEGGGVNAREGEERENGRKFHEKKSGNGGRVRKVRGDEKNAYSAGEDAFLMDREKFLTRVSREKFRSMW